MGDVGSYVVGKRTQTRVQCLLLLVSNDQAFPSP
jgi:hypothetical protein